MSANGFHQLPIVLTFYDLFITLSGGSVSISVFLKLNTLISYQSSLRITHNFINSAMWSTEIFIELNIFEMQ